MLSAMASVYKVLPAADWHAAQSGGVYHGSPVDLRDGFIHFSTAEQLAETLRRHFAGARDLVLLWVDSEAITPASAWRWEPSRGGALFPHLYAALPVSAVLRAQPLALDEHGVHQLPALDA
jgi:uncharacterized protein (DUF952 family)